MELPKIFFKFHFWFSVFVFRGSLSGRQKRRHLKKFKKVRVFVLLESRVQDRVRVNQTQHNTRALRGFLFIKIISDSLDWLFTA